MNKEQVLQQLHRLYQHSDILDTKLKVALSLAIIELSGGRAEIPPKVRKVFDKIEAETAERMAREKAARAAARVKGGR